METKGKKIQSVEKAMAVLDCFWTEQQWLSLSEVAAKTGLSKSTVHALLLSMVDNATIQQDAQTGKYHLGYHLFELGCVAEEWRDARAIAVSHMRSITDTMGESVYLARRCDNDVVLVGSTESSNTFRVSAAVGARLPMYCSSQGKMILAHLPPAELHAYLRAQTFRQLTPYTITDPERLRRELELARQQGYVTENGELRTGLISVAAPIFDSDGSCEFAISAVTLSRGPTPDAQFLRLRDMVIEAASASTDELRRHPRWNGQGCVIWPRG